MGRIVIVNDKMQKGYSYEITKRPGNIDVRMKEALSPKEMLKRGVFSGKMIQDCRDEFPKSWFAQAKLAGIGNAPDHKLNEFKVKSRQSLKKWQNKGWIYGNDVRGWFQWYCRYYQGRRDPNVDELQINRWLAFKRHTGALIKASKKECRKGDPTLQPKRRQALLQWAYDPYIDLK
tara:strand:- start:342 stop:869 length:528 start_codon:yes stop_codon:yes gene_type:complete